jgi:NAD(P)H dehydrogenase (quinone)
MDTVKVAIIYYSATGTVHALAGAAAEGAEKAGAEVRLRKVAELAPVAAIDAKPEWARHLRDTADVPEADLADLEWADAVLFGTPTRFGLPASQLRTFMESTAALWFHGRLAGKVYSAFTASNTAHGGQESTILALANTSTTGAASSCRPVTPIRCSCGRATRTARPTSPATARPATSRSRPRVTRPAASRRRRRR